MEINFVTHNPGKMREAKEILEPGIKVNILEHEYMELRDDDPENIAKQGARFCAKKFKKPVVVEDSGLFIEALNDFPGVNSAYIHKRIGLAGILKLMQGVSNRTCYYKSAVAFCNKGTKPVSFLGIEKGTIAESVRGEKGFGHDPIFIPEGSKETYGEMESPEKVKKFRRTAFLKLRDFLIENPLLMKARKED